MDPEIQQVAVEFKAKILWAGLAPNKSLFAPEYELTHIADELEAIKFIKAHQPAAVVSAFPQHQRSIKFLLEVFLTSPLSVRFLKTQFLTESVLRSAINEVQVLAVFDESASLAYVQSYFERALSEYTQSVSRKRLLEQSKRQLRDLESLNVSLEKIVEERTQHIESSRLEEEDKLNKSRSFVRFIKETSVLSSFEEFLLLMRKEFRKFAGVGEPFLILHQNRTEKNFLHLVQNQLQKSAIVENFEISHKTAGFFGLEKILANTMGRPFLQTLILPLETPLSRSFLDPNVGALLGVEISAKEKDSLPILEYFNERHQVLNICADRLLLEHELNRFSYRWEKIFDSLKDPIAIIDIDHQVLRANKKFFVMSGKKKCFESFAGRTEPCPDCPLTAHPLEKNDGSCQVTTNGRVYQVHSFPIMTENGKSATNFVNLYLDVTAKRELYLRMLQSEKIGAIGLLAGNIAHELNNPLTGIRSLAQVLQKELPEGSPMISDLLEIEKAASRSQQIIRNLLEFSSGETSEKKLVSLDEIVSKTLPLLKTAIRSSRYNLNLNADGCKVLAEPQMIQQVVFNLINNACQAISDKGLIEISTYCQDGQVVFCVGDDGPGVQNEYQEKIFEPFFTTKKEGKGTGLGLSLARKVIEGHGGKIWYEPAPVRGSRFIFSLPRANESNQ